MNGTRPLHRYTEEIEEVGRRSKNTNEVLRRKFSRVSVVSFVAYVVAVSMPGVWTYERALIVGTFGYLFAIGLTGAGLL